MKHAPRAFLPALTLATLIAAPTPLLNAQETYPARPITLVLPYAAGGGTDAIARVFARALEERLGGVIVVENRPGAGGNIATDAVANAAPDGHTLLIGNQGPMVVNPHLYKTMKSDPERALEPITLIANASLVIVVGSGSRVQTLAELVEEARRRPAGLTYGSASHASASHLATLLLERAAGIKALHVAYRGASPALSDVVGGHIDFMITTIPSATGLINGGKLKALAVTGPARAAVLPDVPTAAEVGVPGYVAAAWYGLLAPKGLPSEIRARLESAAGEALTSPELLARLKDDGAAPSAVRAAAFGAFMAAERKRWGEVISAANITLKE
ncbi:MAG: tripartite tricarboxylate transporter substrate binding protein [Hyphomonadaceae bacterium]|jgi:tripartite-type tricarboxylate transporter receptor subunit TctC|nr:tripartite tricarboxylate transporter substrate binding protein [Hyphomonadaceae bacterium]